MTAPRRVSSPKGKARASNQRPAGTGQAEEIAFGQAGFGNALENITQNGFAHDFIKGAAFTFGNASAESFGESSVAKVDAQILVNGEDAFSHAGHYGFAAGEFEVGFFDKLLDAFGHTAHGLSETLHFLRAGFGKSGALARKGFDKVLE